MKKETYTCDHCKKDIVEVDKYQFFLKLNKTGIPDNYRLVHYMAKPPFEYHFCNQYCLADAIKEGMVNL